MYNAYDMRRYLRKSREGRYILEMYKATMAGAGYFSPDLQMAKMYFRANEDELGKEKVLDHFSRRRAQREFSFILSDICFCYDHLGIDFCQMFPEEFYLDLVWEPTDILGFVQRLRLSLHNRSDTTLRNVTLVLCLHFTDMFRGDYEVLSSRTLPIVQAGERKDLEPLKVECRPLGDLKGARDIVECRAILVSNEAVSWVDTKEFRLEEIKQAKRLRTEQKPTVRSPKPNINISDLIPKESIEALVSQIKASLETPDDKRVLRFTLPKEVAVVRPIFRLQTTDGHDRLLAPSENAIREGLIRLGFDLLQTSDAAKALKPELHLSSRYGDLVIGFEAKDGNGYGFSSLRWE